MPFVPTEEQIENLYFLLKQLRRENIKMRLVRFINWSHETDIKNCEIEVLCFEYTDKYIICFDGRIIQDKKWRG